MTTPIEDRLRAAFHNAVAHVRPSPHPSLPSAQRMPARSNRRRLLVGVAAAALVIAVVAAAVLAFDPGGNGAKRPAGPTEPQELTPKEMPRRTVDIEVLLSPDATLSEIRGVRVAILASPDVRAFAFVDQQYAFDLARRRLRHYSVYGPNDPVVAGTVGAEAFVHSFRVQLHEPSGAPALRGEVVKLPGVADILISHGPSTDLEVLLSEDATAADVDGVRDAVRASPEIRSFEFVGQQQAYEEFRCTFRDDPELVESVEPEALPVWFRLRLYDRYAIAQVRARLGLLPGVTQISPGEQLPVC